MEQAGGLDAAIAEEGGNLSGGQRQRLALARALLRDTPAYVFDEATSNVDAESERAIVEVVHELARTKTVVVISHRLAAVFGADRIYVLEDGRVAEAGTHGELLEHGGRMRAYGAGKPSSSASLRRSKRTIPRIG